MSETTKGSAYCACLDSARLPLNPAWPAPRCDGALRLYRSGRRACDCGEHVVEPSRKTESGAGS